ncbi:hypothetical protein [Oceanirhabdus seepicola]|uniref:Uncharacterized protein n=1 Tax=Oceanirhabdus seepicola TaxID=2828781 RepID=A0A9J6NXC9_9CLOT|nr:hypothetical protein [Oceanirhabdus seepicola]MCM1988553.1 hypothetical protein [Oceanirhabdus seepicola]
MRKGKLISIGLCCFIFLSSVIFHYVRLTNGEKKAPTETWSKSLKLSEGNSRSEPAICRIDGELISVFAKNENIEIIKFTDLGEISKKSVIAEGKDIRNIRVVPKVDNLKVMYTELVGDKRKLSLLTLDKKFNIINTVEIFDVIDAEFLNEDKLCILKKKGIGIADWSGEIEAYFESDNLGKIEVIESDGRYFMVALKNSGELLSSLYKLGDKTLKFVEFERINLSSFNSLSEIYLGENEEQFYVLLEMYYKSKYAGIDMIIYSKRDGNVIKSKIDLSNKNKMRDFTKINNKGEFLCSIQRVVGKKRVEYDIARVYLKGSEIEEIEYITKSATQSRYPQYLENTIIFMEEKDSKKANLALLSTMDEVKLMVNNKLNNHEKSYVFSEIFNFIVYSIIFSFFLGWVWMVFGMFVFIGITIYNDRIHDKKKKARIFFLGCCIMTLFKNYEVYGLFYVKANELMTGAMNNEILGMGISVLISIVTSIAAYIGYKDDCESIPFLKFIIWFIPDVVLTMMFLYPYIII